MAEYGRHGVLSGQVIDLRVVFTDEAGVLVTPDAVPDVYIYDESVDTETIESEIAARTFTSALAGPLTPTAISTGFYELEYTVPATSDEGSWHDAWIADVDGGASDDYFTFEVIEAAILTSQAIGTNQLIVVELDSSIADSSGNILGEEVLLSFSTRYNPLYASPDLVRSICGRYINWIPDDTLAFMIYWASREAQYINRGVETAVNKHFRYARSRFVAYEVAKNCLMLPGGASGNQGTGGRKQLGDLLIDNNGATLAAQVPDFILKEICDQRDEWWRVVNAGGTIVPGQGFAPSAAVKGIYDPERRNIGRLWDSPDDYHYRQPTANTKVLRSGRRRGTFTHADRVSGYIAWPKKRGG